MRENEAQAAALAAVAVEAAVVRMSARRRDAAIVAARKAGVSLRRVALAAGLSHTSVATIENREGVVTGVCDGSAS